MSKHTIKWYDAFAAFAVKFIVFTFFSIMFFTIGTVSLHELGHSSIAYFHGCSENLIVFQLGELPYSQMECPQENISFIIWGGLLFTTLFAVIMFFSVRGMFKFYSGVIFSVGLVLSSIDFSFMGGSYFFIILLNLFGFGIFALSITKIALLYIKENIEK